MGEEDVRGALSTLRNAQRTRLKEEEEATNEAEGGKRGCYPQEGEEETGNTSVGASRASAGLKKKVHC